MSFWGETIVDKAGLFGTIVDSFSKQSKGKTMTIKDQNGNTVTRNIERHPKGWAVNVWFGGANGFATDVMRVVFKTRAAARKADISDYPYDPDYVCTTYRGDCE